MFIAVPTTFCHVSSSWMKQIQSTLLHLISVTSILILSYCLHLRLLIGVSSTFMDKDCVCVSVLFHTCYMTHQPFLSWPDSWYFALIKNYEPVRRHCSQTPQSMISSSRETVSSKSLQDNGERLHFVWNTLFCQTGIWRYRKWLVRLRYVYYHLCR